MCHLAHNATDSLAKEHGIGNPNDLEVALAHERHGRERHSFS
jgi:hypothetical protein